MRLQLRRNFLSILKLVFCFFVCFVAPLLRAGDWPQYRGPNHDGISTDIIRTNWSQEPPRQVWKIPFDPALSSFAVSGAKAFTQARRRIADQDQEFCVALNADTGQEIWATPLGIAYYPYGGVGSDDGPRSTPSVDGDRVYVLSSYLRMACLEAGTGQVMWSKDFVAEFGSTVIPWENAASPLIMGDLIFLNCNAADRCLMALRKQDGSVAWSVQDDRMTQATPVAATIAGVPQVIFFAQSGLVAVAPETGAVLWRYPFPFSVSTAASPVVENDVVYCSAAYGSGAGAVRIIQDGSGLAATEIWKTPGANMNHWATPVPQDGYLYGIYGQSSVSLRCIDLTTGKEKWSQAGVGTGGVLLVAGNVLVLTEEGDLVLVKPDSAAYSEVVRYKALQGKCWNVPAISNGRIYARSTTEAVCLDVASKLLPKLKLYPALAGDGGGFRLLLGNEDGSPLELTRLAKIGIFATADLTADPAGWMKLTNAPILTNGQISFDDVHSSSEPQRFFRAQEQP